MDTEKKDWLDRFLNTRVGGAVAIASIVLIFLVTATAFFGSWAYAITTYGWFLGGTLGWIPAAIIALIVFIIIQLLAPFIVILLVIAIVAIIFRVLSSYVS